MEIKEKKVKYDADGFQEIEEVLTTILPTSNKKEITLKDEDYFLIKAIKDLTKEIKRLADK